jgi:hypothetical protein
VEVADEVDGALLFIVEEDCGEGGVELLSSARGVHDHAGELRRDGGVDPPLQDQIDGAPVGIWIGRCVPVDVVQGGAFLFFKIKRVMIVSILR